MDILRIEPVFKQVIWGGSRLRDEFGYDIPGEKTGESWVVSGNSNGDCIIGNGTHKGKTLSWLWKNHYELFYGTKDRKKEDLNTEFPIIIKIIDAKEDLSIQVHPDTNYLYSQGIKSCGKSECWYIIDCLPRATIVLGHNANNRTELYEMIAKAKWDELVREVPIHKGDFFQINPGTLHSVKAGTLLLEIQQNCDITYRIFDYNRIQDGKMRELHIKEGLDVIRTPFVDEAKYHNLEELEAIGNKGGICTPLINCDCYCVWRLDINGDVRYKHIDSFLICSVIDGSGMVHGKNICGGSSVEILKKGDHFILPYGYGDYFFEGKMRLICSAI